MLATPTSLHHLPHTVRLVGHDGAITISRGGGGEVVLTLDGRRADELLPRVAAELARGQHAVGTLVVDVRTADIATRQRCVLWLDALQETVLARHA